MVFTGSHVPEPLEDLEDGASFDYNREPRLCSIKGNPREHYSKRLNPKAGYFRGNCDLPRSPPEKATGYFG